MKKTLQILMILFSMNLFAQTDGYLVHNLNLPLAEFDVESDTSAIRILKIPFLSIQLDLYSSSRISSLINKKNNSLVLTPFDYMNSIAQSSSHILHVNNHLLYYLFRSNNINYSFGLNHRLSLDGGFSDQFLSLLIDGNYQFLNQVISLSDNKIRGYNYLSLFFGYSRSLSKTILSAKIKILSGIGSFGFDPGRTEIFTSENNISYNTPFATLVSSDFTAYYTEKINLLSNLGVACDLSLKYHISENISIYSSVLDLGFIQWQENQLSSNGSYFFNGLDYNVDDDLVEGFTNIYDSIVDIFSINEKNNIKSTRNLPYEINFGLIYNFNNDTKNQIYLNYNFKNLQVSEPFSTISLAYKTYFESSKVTLTPMYALNKFSKVNFSLLINKQWRDSFITNFYVHNIVNIFTDIPTTMSAGLGVEMLFLF